MISIFFYVKNCHCTLHKPFLAKKATIHLGKSSERRPGFHLVQGAGHRSQRLPKSLGTTAENGKLQGDAAEHHLRHQPSIENDSVAQPIQDFHNIVTSYNLEIFIPNARVLVDETEAQEQLTPTVGTKFPTGRSFRRGVQPKVEAGRIVPDGINNNIK
jgi:hypothetical protein